MLPRVSLLAYYFNIPSGKYSFRVKAVNSYGIWAEKKFGPGPRSVPCSEGGK